MKHIQLSDLTFESRDGYERAVLFTPEDLSANTKVQVIRIEPRSEVKPHYHKVRTECFKILSGTGRVMVGDVAVVSKDEMILCEPNVHHAFVNNSDNEYLYVQVIRTNDPSADDLYWVEENKE